MLACKQKRCVAMIYCVYYTLYLLTNQLSDGKQTKISDYILQKQTLYAILLFINGV